MTVSLSGLLADFDLPQVICLLEAGQANGRLELAGPGHATGEVLFARGELLAASAGQLTGEVAAIEVLSWERGEFHFHSGEGGEIDRREIDRSSQGLCLEAMRLIDESHAGDVAFACVPDGPVDELEPSLAAVLAAVGDGRSVRQIAAARGLSLPVSLYYLEQLEARGLLSRCRLRSSAAPADVDGAPATIRVLVVDDSKLMQRVLTRLYESDPQFAVVGVAENGEEALHMLPELRPDVVSLDLYMPVMDGVTTLKRIMLSQPTPTVIVTSASPDDLDLTFESILRFGAIDFITKPAKKRGELGMQSGRILDRLRKAARVNLRGIRMVQPPHRRVRQRVARGECSGMVAALAGTGGCLSFMQLVTGLPTDLPLAVVGVLGFPQVFLKAFVAYLNQSSAFEVQLAQDGVPLYGGVCYLASDSERVGVRRGAEGLVLTVADGGEKASQSALLMDVAREFGDRGVGLLLSGEGGEALAGLAALRAVDGVAMVQLPETCVDPGQPLAAIEAQLVDRIVLLPHIASELSQVFMNRLRRNRQSAGEEREDLWPRMSA